MPSESEIGEVVAVNAGAVREIVLGSRTINALLSSAQAAPDVTLDS